jgi:hypothetical protein
MPTVYVLDYSLVQAIEVQKGAGAVPLRGTSPPCPSYLTEVKNAVMFWINDLDGFIVQEFRGDRKIVLQNQSSEAVPMKD